MAVANPRQTGRKPEIIYNRSTGYGIVTFDKSQRTMKIECWPRYADPTKDVDGQYEGWPVTVSQPENYGRKAIGHLPSLNIRGAQHPVVTIVDERTGEMVYSLRIRGTTFQPKVFTTSQYTVTIEDSATGRVASRKGISLANAQDEVLEISL